MGSWGRARGAWLRAVSPRDRGEGAQSGASRPGGVGRKWGTPAGPQRWGASGCRPGVTDGGPPSGTGGPRPLPGPAGVSRLEGPGGLGAPRPASPSGRWRGSPPRLPRRNWLLAPARARARSRPPSPPHLQPPPPGTAAAARGPRSSSRRLHAAGPAPLKGAAGRSLRWGDFQKSSPHCRGRGLGAEVTGL